MYNLIESNSLEHFPGVAELADALDSKSSGT